MTTSLFTMPADPEPTREGISGPRRLSPLSTKDRVALALFVLVPLAYIGIPALTGHLIAPGDNLNQNLPLRILAGEFLRVGRIPAWNPLIWSGTPLLGGWNAGALFPGTFLFAFLPIGLAWTINVALAPALAATGLYLLLRRFCVGEEGAGIGGLVFAYTGFMAGQSVHFGLALGTAFTPWLLLSLDALLRPESDATTGHLRDLASFRGPSLEPLRSTRTWWWILTFAVATAGTVLAGDPRAISSAAIAVLVYCIVLCVRPLAHRVSGIIALVVAGVLGAALSAVQLLPGLSFLHTSQRGATGITFFATGSIPIRLMFTLVELPFALGTNGSLGLPNYVGVYNLPELTIGTGILALLALGAFLPETAMAFVQRLGGSRRRRTADPRLQLGIWYLFVFLGVILALGTNVPTGRLLVHLPFFGSERLQNRNAVLLDIGLSVFAGLYLDEMLRAIREKRLRVHRLRRGPALVLSLVPIVIALVLIIIEIANPIGFQRFLRVPGPVPKLSHELLGYLIPSAVIALALGAFVLLGFLLRARLAEWALILIALFDVGLFLANASYATAKTSLFRSQTTLSGQLHHLLGGQGRFALYDPYFAITATDPSVVAAIGLPDINALQGNPSIQGYGSIVNSVYQNVTGSHLLNNLKTSILATTTVNTLDLRIFLTPTNYLENPLKNTEAVPLPSNLQNLAHGIPHLTNGPFTISSGSSMTWQLGSTQYLHRITFSVDPTTTTTSTRQLLLFDGAKLVSQESVRLAQARVTVRLDPKAAVTTIELENPASTPVTVISAAVTTAEPNRRFVLNGLLEGFLPVGHWVYVGHVGPFAAFKNTEIHGFAWLQPTSTHTPNTRAATTGRVSITRGAITSEQVMHVLTTKTAILVRSEAYSSGWSVDIAPLNGGADRHLNVHRFGLIQAVTIPAGDWRVTWHYRPRRLLEGLILSAAGLALLLALGMGLFRIERRQRRARHNDRAPSDAGSAKTGGESLETLRDG